MTHRAIPKRGHVLSTVAEAYGGAIRKASNMLGRSLVRSDITLPYDIIFGRQHSEPISSVRRSPAEITGWALVSNWVVGVAVGAICKTDTLADAEKLFLLDDANHGLTEHVPSRVRVAAEAILQKAADSDAYAELLPYILDPHGPGSRLSVRRSPETGKARATKRGLGVYYTPADVANYMVHKSLSPLLFATEAPIVLDPACGTGVFLRTALAEWNQQHHDKNQFIYASTALFGIDIDPLALNAAAYVIVHDCWNAIRTYDITPWAAWRKIRTNLKCVDALGIDPPSVAFNTVLPETQSGRNRYPLNIIFPNISDGPHVVIGNPPYADLGNRTDMSALVARFVSLENAPRSSSDLYPLFIEQMIRLTAPSSHGGAFVLPLSIACNTRPQFTSIRRLIKKTPGEWRFAFFDREPHALFGEDVKTRNSILLWTRVAGESTSEIFTGPLRKWRGDTRAAMFGNIDFTQITQDISDGIPKVYGEQQVSALNKLLRPFSGGLGRFVSTINRSRLSNIRSTTTPHVYVGATAYNFLNVFMNLPSATLRTKMPLSEHPLHKITCASAADATRVYALLSSRLAFWWWHIHGDGFHVSTRFLETIPGGIAFHRKMASDKLAALGSELWEGIRHNPIQSINRGRVSIAFNPMQARELLREIDICLIDALEIDAAFESELERFCDRVISAKPAFDGVSQTQGGKE
jgi:N-6 DNA Methylase